MRTHTIHSDGSRLFARDQGDGPSLLMAHGMWCDHRAYDDVVDELGPSFRTIRIDLRAHGRSDAPYRSWGVADLALDMRNTLDALSIDKAVVVGHSLGGMAALHLALEVPGRLHGLVLAGTSADAETPERRSQLRTLAMTLRMTGPSHWLIRKAAALFFSAEFARRAPDEIDRWCTTVRSMRRRGLLQALEAVRTRPGLMDRLGTIPTPALVLCNAEDPVCDPARSEAMAARLHNGAHRMLPGRGHALPMEHPTAVADAVRQVLQ